MNIMDQWWTVVISHRGNVDWSWPGLLPLLRCSEDKGRNYIWRKGEGIKERERVHTELFRLPPIFYHWAMEVLIVKQKLIVFKFIVTLVIEVMFNIEIGQSYSSKVFVKLQLLGFESSDDFIWFNSCMMKTIIYLLFTNHIYYTRLTFISYLQFFFFTTTIA